MKFLQEVFMKRSHIWLIWACIALLLTIGVTSTVYAQECKKAELGQMTAFPGIYREPIAPDEDPADGLKDLFTILTGYSETRAKDNDTVKESLLYSFPPMVWGKTLLARIINHRELVFAAELPLARRMFLNSLFVSADVRNSSLFGQKLWKDLCAEESFIEAVKEKMDGKDRATFVYMTKSQDLSYSVANIQVKCRRMSASEEGERIFVECSDYYDFEPTENVGYLDDLGKIVNEIGWQGYRLRILTPYSIYTMGVLTIR